MALTLRAKRGTRSFSFESLGSRAMMAADLAITGFSADGTQISVGYEVASQSVAPFNITIYRSADGANLDAAVGSLRVTDSAKLSVGSKTAAWRLAFDDVDSDYFLVARIDSSLEIAETSESNNQLQFAGGVFLTTAGVLHAHGAAANDTVAIDQSATMALSIGGATYSHAASDIASVRIRTHAGADTVTTAATVTKPVLAIGGAGDDLLIGGAASDTCVGGAGNDTLVGQLGADFLYGDDGDDSLYSGAQDSSNAYGGGGYGSGGYGYGEGFTSYGLAGDYGGLLDGGGGADALYGSDGADTLSGSDGNDVVRGGAGADQLIGGYGNDLLYGDDGDDLLHGNEGDDSLYGGAGSDTSYGESGDDYVDGGTGPDTMYAGVNDGSAEGRPVFSDVRIAPEGFGSYKITGKIVDNTNPAGRSVVFSGSCSGTAVVQSDGSFTFYADVSDPALIQLDFTDIDQLAAATLTQLV